MKSVKRPIKKTAYLLPRLLLTGMAMFGMLAVLFCSLVPQVSQLVLCRNLARAPMQQIGPNMLLGGYPRNQELRNLRQQGVGAVISLLDDRLPPERMLQALEERDTRALGLELFKVPMSSLHLHEARNKAQVKVVLQLLQENPGKRFYIHCYGGRRRVGLVQQALMAVGPSGISVAKSLPAPQW